MNPSVHNVKATDFASLSDLAAFEKCKARGGSDQECFRVGDNGIGYWGDNTAQTAVPMCALPPEDIEAKFGRADAQKARNAPVQVTVGSHSCICALCDHMPHKANIHNGAGIDLNPAALNVLHLRSPLSVQATWQWV